MAGRYIPEFLRHAPTAGVQGFAILSALDSAVRGMLVSVWPLAMYRALGDAGVVSRVYFIAGIVTLAAGLLVPWAGRVVPRRWLYTGGVFLYLLGPGLAGFAPPALVPVAYTLTAIGTVTIFVCLNAYVMDYIARADLGRGETLKLFYSAVSWSAGPVLGVWLMGIWRPLPFLVAGFAALVLLAVFWAMRLGNGRLIVRARAPAPNPLAYLGRFAAQPRLIAGWIFAVIRSCGWWVYVVYLPIFCIQNGLGDRVGGIALSFSNGFLFLAPVMLRWMQRRTVPQAVRSGFLGAAIFFVAAVAGEFWAPLAVASLIVATLFLVLLDLCGGLPFLMAVKPSERAEMAAVYSSFRDVSGILTPGAAWIVLLFAPVSGIFAVCGAGLLAAWAVAGRLHPRLGAPRGAARRAS